MFPSRANGKKIGVRLWSYRQSMVFYCCLSVLPLCVIRRNISYIIYHISYIIYHISYIIYHISYIICQLRAGGDFQIALIASIYLVIEWWLYKLCLQRLNALVVSQRDSVLLGYLSCMCDYAALIEPMG